MEYIKYAVYALIVWNIVVFALYGIDKQKAKKKKWRISEKTLIVSAFVMGGVGALSGMMFFRHKTKHLQFRSLLPLALILNIAVAAAAYYIISKVV